MKKIVALALSVGIIICFTRCSQKPSQESPSNNPDSVKKTIIALNDEIFHAIGNPDKYQTYCEDSMLVVGDGYFMTSSNAFSHDLFTHSLVPPHDYTFKLFGNTALLSFLSTPYEIFNNDTIFHSMRNLRTFVFRDGKWKMASNSFGFEQTNYFKPVAGINQKYYPSYAGVYKFNDILDTVFVKDGMLYDKSGGDASWDFPVNNSEEYMSNENMYRATFGRDAKGAVAYMTLFEPDGQKFKCPKIK